MEIWFEPKESFVVGGRSYEPATKYKINSEERLKIYLELKKASGIK